MSSNVIPFPIKQLNSMRRVIFTAICIAVATAANAHDWYEDKIDPQMKYKCCGGFDCRAVPRSSVQPRTRWWLHLFTAQPQHPAGSSTGIPR